MPLSYKLLFLRWEQADWPETWGEGSAHIKAQHPKGTALREVALQSNPGKKEEIWKTT